MKKSRLIVTLMLVALLVTSIAVPAMAASQSANTDYLFTYDPGARVGFSTDSMWKETTNGWVINVNSTSYQHRVTYAMLWTLYSDWSWCVGSQTTPHTGTGVVPGEYVDASQVIGWEFWAGGLLDTADLDVVHTTSGNFNTDR